MLHYSLGRGTTGTPPSTTTMIFAGLGAVPGVPTDFDMSTMRDYLPVMKGWLVGNLGLGQADSAEVPDAETAQALLVYYKARQMRAAAIKEEEEIKTARSDRVWVAVTGLVGVAGVIIAAFALRGGK